MAILLNEPAQPLSRTALDDLSLIEPRARSHAQAHLARELVRYTKGEILGRSVLVSGHRGSGKTSMVLHALHEARAALYSEGRRPLLVRIQGPGLLLETDSLAPDADPSEGATDVGQVLKRVTMVLVNAVMDEVHSSFLRDVARGQPLGRQAPPGELSELSARLRLELEAVPTLRGLRDIWGRAGLLECGLFGAPGAEGAGFQEIRVLWACSRASLITRGKLEQSMGEEQNTERKDASSWKVLTTGKELLNPLFGLLSGSVVGWSLLENDQGGFMAAVMGTLVGLATATTLNFTAERLVRSTEDRSFSFKPDTSVYALSLMLPRLVQQLRDIGLAPVFVIDELDKIPQLRDRMRQLVRHLKALVNEDAFFTFVTDRDYFEYLRWKTEGDDYPEEHTYFTDRLYVSYQSADLHRFLEASLVSDAPAGSDVAAQDARDMERLRYVLLLRSRQHLLELRRQLRQLQGEDGALVVRPGDIERAPVYQREVFIQLAVERVLSTEPLHARISRDPYFAQLASDALYHLAKRWLDGSPTVDLSRGAVERTLLDRMDTEALPEGADRWLDEATLSLLHGEVGRLVGFLRDPSTLESALVRLDEGLLDPPEGEGERWAWRFDAFGHRLRGEPRDTPLDQELAWLDAFADSLKQLGGEALTLGFLAERAGLLPATPSASAFEAARARLARGDGDPVGLRDAEDCARRVVRQAREAAPAVQRALVVAALLGRHLKDFGPEEQLRQGALELEPYLRFLREQGDLTVELERLAGELAEVLGLPPWTEEKTSYIRGLVRGEVALPDMAALRERFWTGWLHRFTRYLETGQTRFPVEAGDLLAALAEVPPRALTQPMLDGEGVTFWSAMAVYGMAGDRESPPWLAVPALRLLGQEGTAEEWATNLIAAGTLSDAVNAALQTWRRALRRRPLTLGQMVAPTWLVIFFDNKAGGMNLVADWPLTEGARGLVLPDPFVERLWGPRDADTPVNLPDLDVSHLALVVPDARAREIAANPEGALDALFSDPPEGLLTSLRPLGPPLLLVSPTTWQTLGRPAQLHPVPSTFEGLNALLAPADDPAPPSDTDPEP
ncbi:MAG: hypothetical protein H6739_35155 [Alphaproteobacteria bacterium]|nr:hypothetical protein [Alphaproteobacteria bacterium]